jgi:hypothetical protein
VRLNTQGSAGSRLPEAVDADAHRSAVETKLRRIIYSIISVVRRRARQVLMPRRRRLSLEVFEAAHMVDHMETVARRNTQGIGRLAEPAPALKRSGFWRWMWN